MVSGPPGGRLAWRLVNALLAAVVCAAVLGLLAFGYGPVPALGRALDPGHGAWTSASGGQLPHSQTLTLPGLSQPATVSFTGHGVPSIGAVSASDAFTVLGYLHARFRLSEMDLERRLGEGRLAGLAGPGGVASDKFELRLGLLRTAQREWAATPPGSPAGQALLAYARGVNDYLAQARRSGQWPSLFGLTGVYPRDWTPVDSLVIQGVLTQELDFTTAPLDYELLDRSLGPGKTMAWFPVLPPGPQHPYDPGPYRNRGIAAAPGLTTATATAAYPVGVAPRGNEPIARSAAFPACVTLRGNDSPECRTHGKRAGAVPGRGVRGRGVRAAGAVLAQVRALPVGQVHAYPDSNAWAANGPAVAGGVSMLAGDPHLSQTLPSVWYQAAIAAPGMTVTGVTVPGLPGVLIGHNAHIAWSLTDVQNQATLFYTERTSKSRPGEYFWRGQWRRMRRYRYLIPVRGAAAVHLTVDQTVHGPVMTKAGQTTSVDWMGNVPSPDLSAMLAVDKASDFGQFRSALADWYAPTQNFVYADDRGNIGAISAGYYPLVRHGQPWLPMPGTGADDVAGVIPYRAVPQVYDPPGHVVATANQRPVGGSYPYYIGTTADFFDPGYRAGQIYASLTGRAHMTTKTFAAVQLNVTDPLARQIVPHLLAALKSQRLSGNQRAAAGLLRGWNGDMTAGSAAATLWWAFWGDYLNAVFQPWWRAAKVPVSKDRFALTVSPQQYSLDQVLAGWTGHDQSNPAFSAPGGPRRTAAAVMRAAFATAVAKLAAKLGGAPPSWTWGRVHTRQFPSLTQAAGLGYGPRPAGGDLWTVNAAEGGLASWIGPSWRMIVAWAGDGKAAGEGVYPGGQSENPASPWYQDQVPDWWDGRYLPMPPAAAAASGPERWSMRP